MKMIKKYKAKHQENSNSKKVIVQKALSYNYVRT